MSLRGWRQRAGPSGLPQFFREKLTKSFITAAAGLAGRTFDYGGYALL